MRERTRELKKIARKDINNIYYHNNSKERKRTDEQNEQHRRDKYNHYFNKWNELLKSAETKAQKEICEDVLSRIHIIR